MNAPWPHDLDEWIGKIFSDETNPAFCQLATVLDNGFPSVRTVHFRMTPKEQLLLFNCHINSRKWANLKVRPFLAACIFHANHQIQLSWEATALLVDSNEKEFEKIRLNQWGLTRADVRKAYWSEFNKDRMTTNIAECCPTFGTVICKPTKWNLYSTPTDHFEDVRVLDFNLENDRWIKSPRSPISGLPIKT